LLELFEFSGTNLTVPEGTQLPGICVYDDVSDWWKVTNKTNSTPCGEDNKVKFDLVLFTDGYQIPGWRTSWQIVENNSSETVYGRGPGFYENLTLYHEWTCLHEGTYTFQFFDAVGYGLFCPGQYVVYLAGFKLASGLGYFGFIDEVVFEVDGASISSLTAN